MWWRHCLFWKCVFQFSFSISMTTSITLIKFVHDEWHDSQSRDFFFLFTFWFSFLSLFRLSLEVVSVLMGKPERRKNLPLWRRRKSITYQFYRRTGEEGLALCVCVCVFVCEWMGRCLYHYWTIAAQGSHPKCHSFRSVCVAPGNQSMLNSSILLFFVWFLLSPPCNFSPPLPPPLRPSPSPCRVRGVPNYNYQKGKITFSRYTVAKPQPADVSHMTLCCSSLTSVGEMSVWELFNPVEL